MEDYVMNESIETREKEEIILDEISDMFQDQEFGFDVFVLMKDEEKTIKKIVFWDRSISGETSFKDKIQNSIAETLLRDFRVEKEEYSLIDNIADNQHKIYILPQDANYAPFECLDFEEDTVGAFSENDYDTADAILFRFRRGTKVIWAYQRVIATLIPNKKGENFLTKVFSTEGNDVFVEMDDKLFAITKKINLLVIGGDIVTKDINLMQSHFGFEEYIRNQASRVVEDITAIGIVSNECKLTEYIERKQKTYAKKMMRIKQYNVIKKTPEELISKIQTVLRWKDVFKIEDGKIVLNTYKDVENLIDLFDERYTISPITDDEFDTDVKKLASDRI